MAKLESCPDCGHQVSKRASKCPQCGGPLWHKTVNDAFLSGKGMGLIDLIPGVRDLPFLARLALVALLIAIAFTFVVPAVRHWNSPEPQAIAQQVSPLISAELRKKPGLKGILVRNVTLVHQGEKNYTGFVDLSLEGKQERLPVEVTYDKGAILWQIKHQ